MFDQIALELSKLTSLISFIFCNSLLPSISKFYIQRIRRHEFNIWGSSTQWLRSSKTLEAAIFKQLVPNGQLLSILTAGVWKYWIQEFELGEDLQRYRKGRTNFGNGA